MKKTKLLTAIACTAGMLAFSVTPAMADATKVVTLGADLTQDQQNTILKYFNVNTNEAQVIYINNAQERALLSSYIPTSQIGTRTVSCAYVKPTSSGGIKVRTANLNYVTCNMIASVLSTSGVTNCEVVAACPFEVSGTGALAGITYAYEQSTGTQLDETKKQLATKELVVTGNLGSEVGNKPATQVINDTKIDVISNNVQNADEIYNIVINEINNQGLEVDQDTINAIVELLQEIADQDYEYEDVEETLDSVSENLSGEAPTEEDASDDLTEEPDPDSILTAVDTEALGTDIPETSTDDPALQEETFTSEEDNSSWDVVDTAVLETPADEATAGSADVATGAETESGSDTASDDGWAVYDADGNEVSQTTDGGEVVDMTASDGQETQLSQDNISGTTTDAADVLSTLDETQQADYEQFQQFLQGEIKGDANALSNTMGIDFVPTFTITLTDEEADALIKELEDVYIDILTSEETQYTTGTYLTAELNALAKDLKDALGLPNTDSENTDVESVDAAAEDILYNYTEEDKTALYNDLMSFFEKLYNETAPAVENTTEETTEATTTAEAEQTYAETEQSYDETEQSYAETEQSYSETEETYEENGYYDEDGNYYSY